MDEPALLASARRDDRGAFDALVAPYLRELHVHCYRMLGGVHDAEDALQETLLSAWRALGSFEERSSVRSWLYRIATNACLAQIRRRPARVLPDAHGPAFTSVDDLGAPLLDVAWIEPYPDGPEAHYELRETVELAFIAALQHLPGNQRAVLILREALAFSAAETGELLDLSVASVNSALQRARKAVGDGIPARRADDPEIRELVERFTDAWERADVPALLELLTVDARLVMPPLPAWFDGRDNVAVFFRKMFETPWRLVPATANGQPAFALYQLREGEFRLSGLNVLTIRGGRVEEITAFLDPASYAPFGFSEKFPGER